MEIALGLYTIAFLHLAGHACFRLLQFLSAPNVLHDLHGLESAAGERIEPRVAHLELMVPERLRRQLYLVALERGFLDAILDRVIVEPFHRLTGWMARLDAFLCDVVLQRAPSLLPEVADDRDE